MNKQRLFTRVHSGLEVDLHLDNGVEITGRLSDLSLRGLYLEADAAPEHGIGCVVEMFPAGREHQLIIEVKGTIARAREVGGIGVSFDELSVEAFERLAALVMTAAQDPSAVENEIEQHLDVEPAE